MKTIDQITIEDIEQIVDNATTVLQNQLEVTFLINKIDQIAKLRYNGTSIDASFVDDLIECVNQQSIGNDLLLVTSYGNEILSALNNKLYE